VVILKNLIPVQKMPVKKMNIADEIFNRILDFIKDGYLKPNEKVMSEREFCDLFETSRTSVREALKGLTSMGIIVKRRDGNYVCDSLTNIIAKPIDILLNSSALNLDEVFEARIAIESQIARIAARKATDKAIMKLEECLDVEEQAPADAVMRKSVDFHMLIAECTDNRILQKMYIIIYRILEEMRNNEKSLRQVYKSQASHRDILNAIKAHDPDQAETALKKHLFLLKYSIKETPN
jgi:GntR family transcriptional repressor for pyruvate dehydrogenase complex